MTTTDSTAPAFDGSHASMYEMAFYPFGQWWPTLATGMQIALVVGFIVVMAAVIWWAVRHEWHHALKLKGRRNPGAGRSGRSGS